MSVYLYAVCRPDVPVPESCGFEGRPLRVVRSRQTAAVVSDRDASAPATSAEELWEHERVVEELMAGHDLLPVRFGTMLDSDAAVTELLGGRGDELSAALDYVAGASELAVRATCTSTPTRERAHALAAGTGQAYLARRLQAQQQADALSDRIDRALRPLAKARKLRAPGFSRAAMNAAYLVARERIDAFVSRVSELDAQMPHAHVLCTGPWPPYSFSERGARAA